MTPYAHLRDVYHWLYRGQVAARCWVTDRTPGSIPNAALPPARLRYRISERISAAEFARIGSGVARKISNALIDAGVAMDGPIDVLDFGCGCGRILRCMAEFYPAAHWHGVDVDAEAIAWCSANLPGCRTCATSALPPLPFGDATFDAIYGLSVITHLDAARQRCWVAELARVLKPDGTLLLSYHGANAALSLTAEQRAQLDRDGLLFLASGKHAGILPDWYQTTWHTEPYLRSLLEPAFADVQFTHIADGVQDFVTARGRR